VLHIGYNRDELTVNRTYPKGRRTILEEGKEAPIGFEPMHKGFAELPTGASLISTGLNVRLFQ
jgi:hypothetical protein